jgi:hypothetical protein
VRKSTRKKKSEDLPNELSSNGPPSGDQVEVTVSILEGGREKGKVGKLPEARVKGEKVSNKKVVQAMYGQGIYGRRKQRDTQTSTFNAW